MMIKNILFVSGLTLAVLSSTTSFANAVDRLYLINGDRVSGTIQSHDGQNILMETGLGTLTINVTDIKNIESSRYTMADFVPKARDAGDETVTSIEPAAGDVTIKDDDSNLWGAEWSGKVNFGFGLKDGNNDTQNINADANTTGKWDKHRASFGVDFDYEEDTDVKTVDERSMFATHDYFFAEKWFWQNRLKLEQDKIEELDLRTNYTSGLGYQFFDRDDLKLQVVAGPGYLRDSYENAPTESDMTAHWGLDYEQKFWDDFIKLYHNHDFNAPADDVSAYIFDSATGITVPLKAGIVASGEVEFDWNNDPISGNTKRDTTYSLKLGYEW